MDCLLCKREPWCSMPQAGLEAWTELETLTELETFEWTGTLVGDAGTTNKSLLTQ
jgi:hypothetical protein